MSISCTATYSPEDNKLRLHSIARLGAETYARVKAAGFSWAPKQGLFVAPAWSPGREDLLLELAGEIDDEDYSPQERAADRAERFGDYRDRRAAEAGAGADRFEGGPSAFGHQDRARAERQAARHDRHRTFAVSQWSKAEYWQSRTAAVIQHALFKSSAQVRRGRILRLEAEQRKHEKTREEYAARYAGWQAVTALEGADKPGRYVSTGTYMGFDPATATPALRAAYALVNSGHCWGEYVHPRTGSQSSVYSHMTDAADPLTPAEAAALWLEGKAEPDAPGSYPARWSAHYALRLTYERAMLEAEGGTAADADMEPGGWIGQRQIHAVNRSPATKRVVSVQIMAPSGWHEDGPLKLKSYNVERLPEGAYRAPTDLERAAFVTEKAGRKAAEKAGKPKTPPLVNPTDVDAERLQALWNARARERHDKARAEHRVFADYQPAEVLRINQAQYSANSKGTYAKLETRALHACGRLARRHSNMWSSEGEAYRKSLGEHAANLRVHDRYDKAPQVIVLTDKPRRPIPLDWAAVEAGTVPAPVPAPETETAGVADGHA